MADYGFPLQPPITHACASVEVATDVSENIIYNIT